MRYRVPQYIEMEDKIFAGLTFRQFVYIVGGAGLAFLSFAYLPKPINMVLTGISIAFGLSMAFIKYNNKPLPALLEAMFFYLSKPKLYIWRVRKVKKKANILKKEEKNPQNQIRLTEGKLKDLSWSLDINENILYTRKKELLRNSLDEFKV